MSTELEAMELALHAFESGRAADRAEAMTALRERLAQPEQEPVAWRFKETKNKPWSISDDGYYISCKRTSGYIIEPLYTAPQQRKPLTDDEMGKFSQFLTDVVTAAGLLSHGKTDKALALRISEFAFNLRTAPPQRKPLTEEEMRALWKSHGYKSALCMRFARAIERAHGIGEKE